MGEDSWEKITLENFHTLVKTEYLRCKFLLKLMLLVMLFIFIVFPYSDYVLYLLSFMLAFYIPYLYTTIKSRNLLKILGDSSTIVDTINVKECRLCRDMSYILSDSDDRVIKATKVYGNIVPDKKLILIRKADGSLYCAIGHEIVYRTYLTFKKLFK